MGGLSGGHAIVIIDGTLLWHRSAWSVLLPPNGPPVKAFMDLQAVLSLRSSILF